VRADGRYLVRAQLRRSGRVLGVHVDPRRAAEPPVGSQEVARAAKSAGIDPIGLASHIGRRTVVTALYADGGMDLADVARHVGHSNPSTSAGYVRSRSGSRNLAWGGRRDRRRVTRVSTRAHRLGAGWPAGAHRPSRIASIRSVPARAVRASESSSRSTATTDRGITVRCMMYAVASRSATDRSVRLPADVG
jgi:hypothetical protein